MPMTHVLKDRQHSLFPDKRLAQNVREEAGRGPVRLPRPNADSGQTKSDAVAETATRIVAKEQPEIAFWAP